MDVLKKYFVLIFIGVINSGCQLTYLLKSAYNQMSILYHREPIDDLLKNDTLSPELRKKLIIVQNVRKFAEESLKLNVGKNYSTFVELHRPYVVWAVNASPRWKLEHHLWYFPIIGSVPYKGFSDETDAKSEALSLESKGLDTYVRGVSAYSTLGWFNDPILSSMLRYSEEDLVNTIIHESVHATIYIKSNADFNERLATFIGDKGTELYYKKMEGVDSFHLKKIENENYDQKIFSEFISQEIESLKKFYSENPIEDLEIRDARFTEIKDRFQNIFLPKMKSDNFKYFNKTKLNNARMLLYKTYIEDLSDFQLLYEQSQEDLNLFLLKIKTLEKSSNPIVDLKNLLKIK